MLRSRDPGKAGLGWVLGNQGGLEHQRRQASSQGHLSKEVPQTGGGMAWGQRGQMSGLWVRRIWILKAKCRKGPWSPIAHPPRSKDNQSQRKSRKGQNQSCDWAPSSCCPGLAVSFWSAKLSNIMKTGGQGRLEFWAFLPACSSCFSMKGHTSEEASTKQQSREWRNDIRISGHRSVGRPSFLCSTYVGSLPTPSSRELPFMSPH